MSEFSVEQYDSMFAAGILTEYDRLELLDGFLVRKMSKGEHHDWSVDDLYGLLFDILPRSVTIRCQNALVLSTSKPEPDYVICKSAAERQGKQPRARGVYLVIEVSESSLGRDRGLKLQLYAEAGIPCYGIVNVIACQIEVYSEPDTANRKYRSRVDYKIGRDIPIIIRKVEIGSIPVAAAFPFAKKKS